MITKHKIKNLSIQFEMEYTALQIHMVNVVLSMWKAFRHFRYTRKHCMFPYFNLISKYHKHCERVSVNSKKILEFFKRGSHFKV